MQESIRDYLETKHNVYIDPKTDQYNLNSYDEAYGWQPVPAEWLQCACCNEMPVSDDEDLAAEMLCDRCAKENDNEIIGYRKGE
ncbi:MAG: hypothetical protein KJN62_07830 [Deltaproteobacteria bacterium]|nr:hypothetical protein [Deltaproteobacteria bacterium]